ncbi:unnamed protein product [Didymodactylos carnosus]|uniref:Nudix hydrolase domain-containing protein n=1 Tax=Didymodactylos carnosus TaxID=1234261 RepID=A0A8S2DP78_9BILA|nr:unnamed protein product [Didymodactylos carnosus]CAF3764523.1 unnamed protein product [Didymodactylos carnosus]
METNPALTTSRPLVGVATILLSSLHPQCILLGRRLSSHGTGTYQLPGGHLEYGESFVNCARRELQEETNLTLNSVPKLVYVTNNLFEDIGKHYVTLFMLAQLDDEQELLKLKCMEPTKCDEWKWVKWTDLKQLNLFKPLETTVNEGFNPFLIEKGTILSP